MFLYRYLFEKRITSLGECLENVFGQFWGMIQHKQLKFSLLSIDTFKRDVVKSSPNKCSLIPA